MRVNDYYSEDGNAITFTRQQASHFAKNIAGDFNPIHDEDSKRFCVPGDLLFSISLSKYGISQHMRVTFSGMVTDGVAIQFPPLDDNITICDTNNKEYLTLERHGDVNHDENLIKSLTRSYVEFSGQTFPHILVPLMANNNAMINTARPLVVYESMAIDMKRLDVSEVVLELDHAEMETEGKRGKATLNFNLVSNGETVGTGSKSMLLSGLRPFDKELMETLVNDYAQRKDSYLQ